MARSLYRTVDVPMDGPSPPPTFGQMQAGLTLDFSFDFTALLADDRDDITALEFSLSPSGDGEALLYNPAWDASRVATFRMQAPTAPRIYMIRCIGIGDSGRIYSTAASITINALAEAAPPPPPPSNDFGNYAVWSLDPDLLVGPDGAILTGPINMGGVWIQEPLTSPSNSETPFFFGDIVATIGGQVGATVLPGVLNEVTVVPPNSGVRLARSISPEQTVFNRGGAGPVRVYPGGDEQIEALAPNAFVTVANNATTKFTWNGNGAWLAS